MKFSVAKRAALRFARREAMRRGLCLARFREIHSIETDLGPEWFAEDARDPAKYATVWYAIGKKLDEVEGNLVRSFGGRVFTFTFKGGK